MGTAIPATMTAVIPLFLVFLYVFGVIAAPFAIVASKESSQRTSLTLILILATFATDSIFVEVKTSNQGNEFCFV